MPRYVSVVRAGLVLAALAGAVWVLGGDHASRDSAVTGVGAVLPPLPADGAQSEEAPSSGLDAGVLPPSTNTDAKRDTSEKPPEWPHPRFSERRDERHEMVAGQLEIEGRNVRDPKVLEAMRVVPRHLFVPERLRGRAYRDQPLPIGLGQTISQPYIVALMTEQLRLDEKDVVLEIGTGSGYQAAVLAELTPHVFTIEIFGELARESRKRLAELGYATVQARHADGYFGWPEVGPFDAIIVTCAANQVPPPLLQQLAPGGRMIIPLGRARLVQELVVIDKDREGNISSRSILPVRFVPFLRGTR